MCVFFVTTLFTYLSTLSCNSFTTRYTGPISTPYTVFLECSVLGGGRRLFNFFFLLIISLHV